MAEYEGIWSEYRPTYWDGWSAVKRMGGLVRCRDCEYFEQDYTDGAMFDETVCWAWDNGHDYPSYTNPDGFCYRGKRRESE